VYRTDLSLLKTTPSAGLTKQYLADAAYQLLDENQKLREAIHRAHEELEFGGKPTSSLGRCLREWLDDTRCLLEQK